MLLAKPSYVFCCRAQSSLSRDDYLLFRFTANYSVGKLPELESLQLWGPGEAHVQVSLFHASLPVHPEAQVCLEWAVSGHQQRLAGIAAGMYLITNQAEKPLTVATMVSPYIHSSHVSNTVSMGCVLGHCSTQSQQGVLPPTPSPLCTTPTCSTGGANHCTFSSCESDHIRQEVCAEVFLLSLLLLPVMVLSFVMSDLKLGPSAPKMCRLFSVKLIRSCPGRCAST